MKQYIEFYIEQEKKIKESCNPLLNVERAEAFEVFQKQGFPKHGSENYQYTDIEKLLETDFGFYLGSSGEKIDPYKVFKCNVPNLSSYVHFNINGQFFHKDLSEQLPKGVFSGSLNSFAKDYSEIFSRYYNKQAKQKGDGVAAFNTSFVQDGYVLYIPKNIVIEKPIQLTNIFNTPVDTLVNRRLLIILEANAQAKLLVCDHSMDEKTKVAATQVTEIYLEENAVFDLYELEESTENTIRIASTFVDQAASSNMMLNNITLSNGTTRNNYHIDLNGEGAETNLYGMAISDRNQQVDNYSVINHNVAHCRSNELLKYVLDEEAIGVFSGKINVVQDAQKTEAYQNNRNLLNGNLCRMYSKPQLEIYADDVKCSHGMTTGQLDETALFYMRSRGIQEKEARILLRFAFTDDVIKGIRLDSLQDRLRLLIEKRFRGEPLKCQGCL